MNGRLPLLILLVALSVLLGTAACGDDSGSRSNQASPTQTPANGSTGAAAPTTSSSGGSSNALPGVSTSPPGSPSTTSATSSWPIVLRLDVLERHPHDTTAFTEGLVWSGGRLFESTGLNGWSTVREVDLSGRVVRQTKLADDQFGEGLAAVGDKLVQLTWRNGVAIVWDRETLAEVRRFSYKGEGWGLCYDEPRRRLVQSDGSSELTFRNPDDFSVIGKVSVSRRGRSLDQINELECTDDGVWANVWHSNQIVRIDPGSGQVTAEVDAKSLAPPNRGSEDVLNGIARRADGTWLVTGKNWPTMYVVRFAS